MASLTSFGSCCSFVGLSPPKTLPMDRRDEEDCAAAAGEVVRIVKEDCWKAETAAMPMHNIVVSNFLVIMVDSF